MGGSIKYHWDNYPADTDTTNVLNMYTLYQEAIYWLTEKELLVLNELLRSVAKQIYDKPKEGDV